MKRFIYYYVILAHGLCSCTSATVKTEPRQAIISFIFDDLNSSDSVVKIIFDEYGFKPSFALTANRLNSETAPLYKSYSDEGISILSHSYSHIRMTNSDKITKGSILSELVNSKEIIESYGIPVYGFVTPYSFMHPDFLNQLDSIYAYAFTNNNNGFYNHFVHKHHLSRYGIEANISTHNHNIDSIKSRIDKAIENNELLVFYGHSMPSNYKEDFDKPRINCNDLKAILTYLKEKSDYRKCRILTSDDAILEYYE